TFRPRDSHEHDVQERRRGSTRVGRNSCSCRPAKPSWAGVSNTLLSPLHSALGTRSASDRPDSSHAAPTCWTSWRDGSSCQVEGSLVSANAVPPGTVATASISCPGGSPSRCARYSRIAAAGDSEAYTQGSLERLRKNLKH